MDKAVSLTPDSLPCSCNGYSDGIAPSSGFPNTFLTASPAGHLWQDWANRGSGLLKVRDKLLPLEVFSNTESRL